jgi:hypothetical protein
MSDVRGRAAQALHSSLFRSTVLPVALLSGVLLVTSACGGEPGAVSPPVATGEWSTAGCAMPRSPLLTTIGGTDVPATPPTLSAAMNRIEDGGRQRFADSYAGLEVDQLRVRAIVYRVPSAPFDDFLRISAQDACIVVRDAAHSLAELRTWHDRIAADLGMWTDRGVRISTVGARHDGAGVEVGTQDVVRARQELPVHYGTEAPLVFVEQGPVTPLPATGRQQAAQPGG